jgi:spermidine synthase
LTDGIGAAVIAPDSAASDDDTGSGEKPYPKGVLIDTADIPGGGHLYLVRHGRQFEIMFGEEQLMSSWDIRSEEALATLVCDRLETGSPRMLIGGLGMGFTLCSALAGLPASAEIVVSELVPKIVEWAAGPLASIFGKSLSDPRVLIEIRDVHDIIDEETDSFDAILLDVDNGPDGLVKLANERLYSNWGLRAAHSALRPGGVLAVWSAYPDQSFCERLSAAGFAVEEHEIFSTPAKDDAPYIIWLAAKLA